MYFKMSEFNNLIKFKANKQHLIVNQPSFYLHPQLSHDHHNYQIKLYNNYPIVNSFNDPCVLVVVVVVVVLKLCYYNNLVLLGPDQMVP
jgi:hypothetical protein